MIYFFAGDTCEVRECAEGRELILRPTRQLWIFLGAFGYVLPASYYGLLMPFWGGMPLASRIVALLGCTFVLACAFVPCWRGLHTLRVLRRPDTSWRWQRGGEKYEFPAGCIPELDRMHRLVFKNYSRRLTSTGNPGAIIVFLETGNLEIPSTSRNPAGLRMTLVDGVRVVSPVWSQWSARFDLFFGIFVALGVLAWCLLSRYPGSLSVIMSAIAAMYGFYLVTTLLTIRLSLLAAFGRIRYRLEDDGTWEYMASFGPIHERLRVTRDTECTLQPSQLGIVLVQNDRRHFLIGANTMRDNSWLVALLS